MPAVYSSDILCGSVVINHIQKTTRLGCDRANAQAGMGGSVRLSPKMPASFCNMTQGEEAWKSGLASGTVKEKISS